MSLRNRIAKALLALAGYHTTDWTPHRRTWIPASRPSREEITKAQRERLLAWSREMERKDALYNRFLDLCEQYVVGPTGLRISSGSADRAWADRADAAWSGWEPYCDISSRFSFGSRQSLLVREIAVAGEAFVHLTVGDSGRRRLQFIEAEYIGTPDRLADREGKDIFDGIQVDSNFRPVMYYLKTGHGIPAASMVHIYEPSRFGQIRGLPLLYAVLADMIDLQELQELSMQKAKDVAITSKVVTTSSGELNAADLLLTNAGTTTAPSYYKDVIGAETIVIKPGDKYEEFRSDQPSVATQEFWRYVSQKTMAGLGLPLEIVIMQSLQGTMTRAALDMASSYFRCRTAVIGEFCGRIWEYVIGTDTSLRPLPADWRKIRFTPPRAINVDVGRNSNALIQEYKTGFKTLEQIAAETGQDWREILQQRALEMRTAAEIEAENGLDKGSLLSASEAPPQQQPQEVTQ